MRSTPIMGPMNTATRGGHGEPARRLALRRLADRASANIPATSKPVCAAISTKHVAT